MTAKEAAVALANKNFTPNETHTEFSPIYLAPTSNVKDTMKLYAGAETVLSVGATGAHCYEAMLNGAKKVDMFDINELQRLFFEYMKTAIKVFEYEDFLKHFTLLFQKPLMQKHEIENLLGVELFEELAPYLPEEVYDVFAPLIFTRYTPDLICSGLFRFEYNIMNSYLRKFASLYDIHSYYKLQSMLRNETCEISYHKANIIDIPKKFNGNTYDLIVLDNILQYYQDIPLLDTPYKVNQFVDKELSALLNPDGTIQVGYGFIVATDTVKEGLGLRKETNPFKAMEIKEQLKQEINYNLIKKWNHYSYDFIPGVESIRNDCENVVLSYKKRI